MWVARNSLLAILIAVALGASACADSESIDRVSAIEALETTGLSNAEATCVADGLILLDEIDAADPRIARGPAERDALVGARNRCIGSVPETEVAGVQERPGESEFTTERPNSSDSELEEVETLTDDALVAVGTASELRIQAIETLTRLGRSTENATCVVDHILTSEADRAVLVSDSFGLGLVPIEATAFAACSGTN